MPVNTMSDELKWKEPVKILETTATTGTTLGDEYIGKFFILLSVYNSNAVKLKVRPRPATDATSGWIDLKHEGNAVTFDEAGVCREVKFSRNFQYRLEVDSAGAEAWLDIVPA